MYLSDDDALMSQPQAQKSSLFKTLIIKKKYPKVVGVSSKQSKR